METKKLSFIIYYLLFIISSSMSAQQTTRVLSPDGLTYLDVKFEDGKLSYSAGYRTIAKAKKKGAKADTLDVPMVLDSPLGVYTNVADFSKDLTLKETIRPEGTIKHNYHLRQGKQSEINNEENGLGLVLTTPQRRNGGVIMTVQFNHRHWRSFRLPASHRCHCFHLPTKRPYGRVEAHQAQL